ncbi:MAG: tripartite tricarboxylate transporter TctB family protein [Desulfovibrio sp.]|nr:tripartite tricarboxylate transporter TctB family protein [Desulfovibrio sp.]
MRKSTADMLAGAAFLAVALAFWVQLDAEEGISRIFPLGLITFITVGGIWFIAKGFWRRTREGLGDANASRTGWKRVGIITAASVTYALLVPTLGFFASTGSFLFVTLFVLSNQELSLSSRGLRALLFAVLFCLAIWAGFVKMLNVPTPQGLLF